MDMSNKKNYSVARETFHGYIESTRDSLLLFEACKRGIIPRITRRLQDRERYLIRSGSIFCFDEKESGIKRWTDGLIWSPSRILGNFLIYREMDDKKAPRIGSTDDYGVMQGGLKKFDNETLKSRSSSIASNNGYVTAPDLLRNQREKALVGSLKNSSKFKRNGLIKKSISLIVDGVQQHIVSYYTKEDVLSNRLKTPSSIVELSSLEVSAGLRLRQNFRIPIFLSEEASDDRFMEDFSSCNSTKRKYSNITQEQPSFELTSSPSSFSSSSSSTNSGNMNQFLSSLNNQPQNPQFFATQPSLMNVPDDLYTSVTQITNTKIQQLSSSLVNSHINSNTQHNEIPNNATISAHLPQPVSNGYKDTDAILTQNLSCESPINDMSQLYQQKKTVTHTIVNPITVPTSAGGKNKTKEQVSDILRDQNLSYIKKTNRNNNITTAKSFSNTNSNTSYNSSSSRMSMNFTEQTNTSNITTTAQNLINPRGGYYSTAYFDDYHQGQNPHQHLFSSSSFHAINHAAIPNRTEIATNSFMTDMNILLGTGWNEFELQM